MGTDSNARNSPIDKDKNGIDGVNVILDLRFNTLLVQLVLLEAASVSYAGCVENADLGEDITHAHHIHNAHTYHYAVLAPKLVKSGRVGLALVVMATLLVGMVENIEVVVINVVASNDIGDEF